MFVGTLEIKLRAVWVSSLKEKRMVIKSLINKVKNKFNVSISEVDNQDNHKILTIGIACVSNDTVQINSILDNVINFIEANSEAEIFDIYKSII